ncbi:hypothetical protein AWENTII_004095 [Aspergillus wentii]
MIAPRQHFDNPISTPDRGLSIMYSSRIYSVPGMDVEWDLHFKSKKERKFFKSPAPGLLVATSLRACNARFRRRPRRLDRGSRNVGGRNGSGHPQIPHSMKDGGVDIISTVRRR